MVSDSIADGLAGELPDSSPVTGVLPENEGDEVEAALDGAEFHEEAAEEQDDEEEEEEEDAEYQLEFGADMDTFDFAQEGGVEFYRQFERLEYEALAERKRKAIQEKPAGPAKKPRLDEHLGATMEEISEMMNFGSRRKSKAPKRRGRQKGSRNKLSPEISRKLADATFCYASGDYDEAIPILQEVVRLAPNLPDAYHRLGLIYDATGCRKKALNFHMIAAHLSPKDPSLWKKLIAWSIEEKNTGQVRYCLSKAITADPKDVGLRFSQALLYCELGEYQKAAESYDLIVALHPSNIVARKMAAKMYKKCGQIDKAVSILEDYVNNQSSEADLSVLILLLDLLMENGAHSQALHLIDFAANSAYCSEKELPLNLKAKAVICHAHLGNIEHAENFVRDLEQLPIEGCTNMITEVGDSLGNLGFFDSALKFYHVVENMITNDDVRAELHLKIAQCYISKVERGNAITFFYKALSRMEGNIDARITLCSILLEEGKEDEAIILLLPAQSLDPVSNVDSSQTKPWWSDGKVRIQLAKVYRAKGMLEDFVHTIFSSIKETLTIEKMNQKVRMKKRLTKSVLVERVKLLDEVPTGNVFRGFKPIATTSELVKASRAKKSLQKKAAIREEKKAATLAAGIDWQSEDSDDEAPRKVALEPPLPGFLKDKDHYQLIIDLCKVLASLRRYSDALEVIVLTLRLTNNAISDKQKEELRALGAQIAYNTTESKYGYGFARNIVRQHPHSIAAWNCYYKVVSRFESRLRSCRRNQQATSVDQLLMSDLSAKTIDESFLPSFADNYKIGSKHPKYMRQQKGCVAPMIIMGHQFTIISQHQAAARQYLEAYRLQPENPLINLCVGTALINLALGHRLRNKHQCVAQGLAFLYNYLRICRDSQEALYNVARAYHHVGLVTLAASYYEKVLIMQEKDHPIPKLPYEDSTVLDNPKSGYCSLHREAAYNLHLIYKRSGAVDLARQILKQYCSP